MRVLFLLLSLGTLAGCHPPHPAVVAVRHEEERLPHFLRSPALRNPHLQEILPLTSLLHKGENLVYQRDTDDVSRQEIYNILTHAGLIPRRPGYYRPTKYRSKSAHRQTENILNSESFSELFHNPELLQHL